MDYQIVWSPEALADVEAIASYIARDSAVYAQAVVEKILETARHVREFPFMGRIVPELGQETIRERLVFNGECESMRLSSSVEFLKTPC